MADAINITVTGASGPPGPASGPLGANSVEAVHITNDPTKLAALQTTLGISDTGTFGDEGARRGIDNNIGGSIIPATNAPVYVGVTGTGDDGVVIDSGANFPAGIGLRRAGGTAAAPTDLAAGLQSGYIDFRAKSGAYFWNHASIDTIIDTGVAYAAGNLPPGKMRFATALDNTGAKVRMEIMPGGGVEIGAHNGEDYYSPVLFGAPRLYVHSLANDWTAVIRANPAAGAGYGLRAHSLGETAGDLPLAVSSGAGTGSFKFVVTGQGRVGIGTTTPACALDVSGPVAVGSYTVATVPTPTRVGQIIYVSNEVDGATIAFSDGAAWRRVSDRAVIA